MATELKEKATHVECVYVDRKALLQEAKRYWFLRRVQDILLSGFALLVLWPVMALFAFIIWLENPKASPLFKQVRVGRDGREFYLYKLRSMIPNAEEKLGDVLEQNEMTGPVFKIKDDPRITKVGKFIRRTSIDELPQLWNVLKGEMSIVGPRPPLPREVAQYNDYQKQRLYITPGLTCYWQIQPSRNEISFDEWVALDIKYMMERSFITDWKIIFKTFGAVFGMEGQ